MLPTLCFPCEQFGKDATSYEYRPIDDCSASGLNLATSTCEKMRMLGLGTLLASAREVREVFSEWEDDGLPVFAKGDHEKAYRQWPVHKDDYNLVVILMWNDKIGSHGGFGQIPDNKIIGLTSPDPLDAYSPADRCGSANSPSGVTDTRKFVPGISTNFKADAWQSRGTRSADQ